jgi:hypothetical protein
MNNTSAPTWFAEDLAIRDVDTHYGVRTQNYVSGRAICKCFDHFLAGGLEKLSGVCGLPLNVANEVPRATAGS